ncbi:MAG: GNAT family N-acetyltransferase [Nanoarchaeota archaeon]|nr:GNAT family N-acetyltransferase [Nanoarchaeota archaeon]
MIIRPAIIEDIDAVKSLDEVWEKESNVGGESRNYLKNCIKHSRLFVAQEDDKLIGYSLFTLKKAKKQEYSTLKKGQKYLFIDYVYVLKDYRNKKIGNKLIKAIEDYARKIKIGSVYLYAVSSEPEKLISFYKKKGYDVSYVMMYKRLKIKK